MQNGQRKWQVHLVISSFPFSTDRWKQVETLNGKTLRSVASYIAQGWPKLQHQSNLELKPCYSLRDELII